MLSSSKNRKLKAAAALVFLIVAGVTFASAQSTKPSSTSSEEARLRTFLDKNGGYRDSYGGYYDPRAGTYTDEKGGVLDNWEGYTFKDGSYKSKFGDYLDAPTNTVQFARGGKTKVPAGSTAADVIKVMRQSVEENGGYDKNFIQRAMLGQIAKDHPIVPNKPAASVSVDEARLRSYIDKNGGYKDKLGGYYNPTAGTYTDEVGGVVDNWMGYTYKDGSYKSKFGDFWDARTKTFKLANGEVIKSPETSPADAVTMMRQTVEENGGYDKDFMRKSMMAAIAKEHPPK